MVRRHLHPRELNHEAIWLGVSLVSLCGVWMWLGPLHLPAPPCAFHHWTGLPCPTCGVTRCVREILHWDWLAAAGINPLAFVSFAAIGLYDLYAATVLLFRLPRMRFDAVPVGTRHILRYGLITAILLNWAWLVWMRV
jgi:hypothetical protein